MSDPSGPDQQAFRAFRAAFRRAASACPDEAGEAWYRFAGRPVRLRVVGRRLAEHVGRAFGHLRDARPGAAAASLTIDLWDGAATGVACPPAPEAPPERTWVAEDGAFASSADGRLVWYRRPTFVQWLDRPAQAIVGWSASADGLSIFERTKPLRMLLPLWYADLGVQIIHAGLVSRDGQGVLFGGAGGVGKSATSLACLLAGFDWLGDDYVGLLEPADGRGFRGLSLFSSARLKADDLARLPGLAEHAIPGDDHGQEKALLLLAEPFPERLARRAEIRVLALPRVVDGSPSRVRPAARGEALLAIAPSCLIIPLTPGARGFERLARLVEHVPTYWLELGRDPLGIAASVDELLARAAQSAP